MLPQHVELVVASRGSVTYISLRDCATAEAVDGSHFSEEGAATILDTTLKREILEFMNT